MKAPVLSLIIFLCLCQNYIAAAKCNHTQVEICIDNDFTHCLCVNCKKCPPGEGLQPQCSSQVVMQVPKCVKCKPGVTYSNNNDIGSRIPCHKCIGEDTLQPCNSTHNTICSKDCARGYKRNAVYNTCEKDINDDIWTTKSPNKHSEEHKNSTQAPQERNTSSTPQTSTHEVPTIIKYLKSEANGNSPVGVYIACALAPAIACCVIVLLIYKNWKTIRRKLRKVRSISYDTELQSTALICDTVLLKDISTDLRDLISADISNRAKGAVKNWRHIGEGYGMTYKELNLIKQGGEKDSTYHGELLLDKILSERPNETLNNFIDALKKVKRNDVINSIREEFSAANLR